MKKWVYLMMLIWALLLSGCGTDEELRGEYLLLYHSEYCSDRGEQLIRAIKEKSNEKFKRLLCNNILAEQENLDAQIEEFIKLFDGRIVSYDEPDVEPPGWSREYGEYTEAHTWVRIDNIMTDKGGVYTIEFRDQLIAMKNEGLVGIGYIVIEGEGKEKIIEVDDKFLEY